MAGEASRINGKKGGRRFGSKATHTIRAIEMRRKLISMFHDDADAVYSVLIKTAKTGDIPAIKELFDRVWGKAPQSIATPDIKEALQIIFDSSFKGK